MYGLFYVGPPHSIFFNSHNIKSKHNYLVFNLPYFLPTELLFVFV